MTEIDFDELDKAVNSLMADVSKPESEAPTSTSTPTPVSPSTSAPSPASTTSSVPVSNSASVNGDVKSAAPSLAAKRRGQFMDIVRPAGGGKPTTTRHQGVTIAPSPETTAASTSDAEAEAPAVLNTLPASPVSPDNSKSEPSVTTEVAQDEAATKSEWPDPIDLANAEPKEQTGGDAQSEDLPTNDSSAGETSSPLESPFLPDAKPEKRPLGGLTSTEPVTADEPSVDAGEASATAAPATNSPLPAELHGNVVAIESESTGQGQQASPEVEIPSAAEPVEPVEEKLAEKSVENTPTLPGGGSIPQQYKEAPSTGDQTNGSIYDTANYHKAIEAHANGGKHGSAFKIAIWIVLLLVIGAGAGAAFFMFTR